MTAKFALYDLDKTVLRHASFTPFLLFAARARAPLRQMLLPAWILAMAGYKLGFISRGQLKQVGLRLFLGNRVDDLALARLGEAFCAWVMPRWISQAAAQSIEADRAEGNRLVMVTAAMGFYAVPIARELRFDEVLATGHRTERGRCLLDGDNCYGVAKVLRVEQLLAQLYVNRASSRFKFYSDSMSDAPLFDWCDEAIFVNGSRRENARAMRRGWKVSQF